ncbi:MAG: hypothetical protein HYV97_16150 [Bdellovibrio sp.]|nr:hypothetical protein [Bdellovibrio sp.]
MSLTTPQMSEDLSVLPGENWFFYWKTSVSLWEQKMSQIRGHRVFIPLNWAFHSETGDVYDFGELRPEANLKKLIEVCNSLGKDFTFLLPIGPAPFIANGGYPTLLARIPSSLNNQASLSVVNNDGQIHKFFSFYDPRVFKGFIEWIKAMNNYFKKFALRPSLFAIKSGYFDGLNFCSYTDDNSVAFDSSFARFLKSDGSDKTLSYEDEQVQRNEFGLSIENLYLETVKSELNDYWDGVLPMAFLGGHPSRTIIQGLAPTFSYSYLSELNTALATGILASSALVEESVKKTVLGKQIRDVNNILVWDGKFYPSSHDDSIGGPYKPLRLAYMYVDRKFGLAQHSFSTAGTRNFLEKKFSNCWEFREVNSFEFDETTDLNGVHLFYLRDLDKKSFAKILRLFMGGGKIILDRGGASNEQIQRLELFVLENNLSVERIQYLGPIQNISLGEGRFVMTDVAASHLQNPQDQYNFWLKLFSSFELKSFELGDIDIPYLWWIKIPSNLELKFEEMRRLGLYNPTSYKKKIRFDIPKNFVFAKMLDSFRTTLQTFPNEIEIQLLPDGFVALDFGRFS